MNNVSIEFGPSADAILANPDWDVRFSCPLAAPFSLDLTEEELLFNDTILARIYCVVPPAYGKDLTVYAVLNDTDGFGEFEREVRFARED